MNCIDRGIGISNRLRKRCRPEQREGPGGGVALDPAHMSTSPPPRPPHSFRGDINRAGVFFSSLLKGPSITLATFVTLGGLEKHDSSNRLR